MLENDDFTPPFHPCPPELSSSLPKFHKTLYFLLNKQKTGAVLSGDDTKLLLTASIYLYLVGMQFYKISGWACSDYVPVYGFSGDAFKASADGFSILPDKLELSFYCYGRAGHCYRSANEYKRASFCFFKAFEIAKKLSRFDLMAYCSSDGWTVILDRWIFLKNCYNVRFDEIVDLHEFLQLISGYDFQWLVWYLMKGENFVAHVAKQTRDGGIDIHGKIAVNGSEETVIVQCKKPLNPLRKVSASEIRDLLGAYVIHRPHRLMFFTTTDYTQDAIEASKLSGLNISLVNGAELFERLKNVQASNVDLVGIDDSFFEERSALISASEISDFPKELIHETFEHQTSISNRFYMNSLLNDWLSSLPNLGFRRDITI